MSLGVIGKSPASRYKRGDHQCATACATELGPGPLACLCCHAVVWARDTSSGKVKAFIVEQVRLPLTSNVNPRTKDRCLLFVIPTGCSSSSLACVCLFIAPPPPPPTRFLSRTHANAHAVTLRAAALLGHGMVFPPPRPSLPSPVWSAWGSHQCVVCACRGRRDTPQPKLRTRSHSGACKTQTSLWRVASCPTQRCFLVPIRLETQPRWVSSTHLSSSGLHIQPNVARWRGSPPSRVCNDIMYGSHCQAVLEALLAGPDHLTAPFQTLGRFSICRPLPLPLPFTFVGCHSLPASFFPFFAFPIRSVFVVAPC